jgi:pimeloyl-ACP methyl ester carboxylesterase
MKKIYIVHGWAYATEKWQPFLDKLKSMGIVPVFFKIPGLSAPMNAVWGLDDYVDWLAKELGEEKGRVILLGHSNGGRICLVYVSKYPEKVKKLILIDSAGIYANGLQIRFKRFVFGNLARFGRRFTDSERLRKFLYKLTRESDYERADPILRKTMHNLITYDVSHLLAGIHIPVVIIWGERDKITPLKDGKIMQGLLKNSKLYVVPGARHSPMFTNVDEVGEIIRQEFES